MVPKAWKQFKNKKLAIIQKFLRGYSVHKRVLFKLRTNKLKSNFEFFNRIKEGLLSNSQIKIRYYWFKWRKRAQIKAKELTKKNNRKGKGGKAKYLKKGSIVYKNTSGNMNSTTKKIDLKVRLELNNPVSKVLSSGIPMKMESPLTIKTNHKYSESQNPVESIIEEVEK